MYEITNLIAGGYRCSVMYQDGTERWFVSSYRDAITAVIRAARSLNNAYIREDDIVFVNETTQPVEISAADRTLLDEIRRGAKVVLDHDDYRLKYRLTEDECLRIVGVREGKLEIVSRPQGRG